MTFRSLVLAVLVCLWALTLTPRTAFAAPAQQVYVGVYLHDVTKFDQKDGVFDADLELWAKWLGDFTPENLRIANAADTERTLLGEESDGQWHSARWRVRGTLRGEFPLHRFPFDNQTIGVLLELPESEGKLVPDLAGSGMRESFSITGWLYEPVFKPRVDQATYRSDLGSIANEGKPTPVRRVAFEVSLKRPLLMAATKLFLPLMLILLVAMIALWVHPKWLDVRSGVGVTALLACFAFQFSVADTMPSVSYMTIADVLFTLAYAATAALLFVSVVAAYFQDRGKDHIWRRLDYGTLTVVPLGLLLVGAIVVHEPEPPPPAPIAPLAGPRTPSSRDVVRIGINQLQSASGGLAGRGTSWGTVRSELDGSRMAALAEEVPSITSHALRFLADGQLEVTWRLRENLLWSDGKPLTSDDLRFALEVSPDPNVVEVRVLDRRALLVRYKERVAIALESILPLPRHSLESVFKEGGFEAVREYRRTHLVPSVGPYRVVEFLAEDRCVLEANPHFAGNPPSIRRIELRRYADDETLVRAFESAELDLIAPNSISPESAQALASRRPDAVTIRPSELQLFLHPDLSVPLLARHEAREALLMAIDRERIRAIFGAAATVSHVPVPGPDPEGTLRVPYGPEVAKGRLAEVGVPLQPLPLFHGPRRVDREIAQGLTKDLAAVGLVVTPTEVVKLADLYRQRKHGGLLLTQTTGERDAFPEKYWSLPQVGGKFDQSHRNDAFDDSIAALVEREERALYQERREQIRDLLFVEYSKRLPNLPLVFVADNIVAVPDLHGWTEGSGANFGTTIERWYFGTGAAAPVPEPAKSAIP